MRPVVWTTVGAGFVLAGVFVLSILSDLTVWHLVTDPAAAFRFPPWAGVLSWLGIFVLIAVSAVCLVGWHLSADDDRRRMLLSFGLLSLALAFDDAFVIHDFVLPQVLGVDEIVMFGLYAVAFAAAGWMHRRSILDSEWLLLATAVGLMGLSVALDVLVPVQEMSREQQHLQAFIEESLKFGGFLFWMLYFARFTFHTLRLGPVRKA